MTDDRGLLDAGLLAQPGGDLGGRDVGREHVDLGHLDVVELGRERVGSLARARSGLDASTSTEPTSRASARAAFSARLRPPDVSARLRVGVARGAGLARLRDVVAQDEQLHRRSSAFRASLRERAQRERRVHGDARRHALLVQHHAVGVARRALAGVCPAARPGTSSRRESPRARRRSPRRPSAATRSDVNARSPSRSVDDAAARTRSARRRSPSPGSPARA